jgi:membrane protein implicated in regulation of membrane protease activity
MAGIFVLGLPGIAFIVFMLNAALRLDPQQTMAFAWTTLILLVVLEAVFLILLLRRRQRKDESREMNQFKASQTNELEMQHPRALAEPISSVTEHTTRAFDAIPRERS